MSDNSGSSTQEPGETFIDTSLKRSYPIFSAMDTDNTDTHLENTLSFSLPTSACISNRTLACSCHPQVNHGSGDT
jgi:hypothetical protein